jgi:hypothetical protein
MTYCIYFQIPQLWSHCLPDNSDALLINRLEAIAAKEKKQKRKAAEKQAEINRKAAEKEQRDAEKQAEKVRKIAEKQAEKDRKAAEKQAEKDRKAAEKARKGKLLIRIPPSKFLLSQTIY